MLSLFELFGFRWSLVTVVGVAALAVRGAAVDVAAEEEVEGSVLTIDLPSTLVADVVEAVVAVVEQTSAVTVPEAGMVVDEEIAPTALVSTSELERAGAGVVALASVELVEDEAGTPVDDEVAAAAVVVVEEAVSGSILAVSCSFTELSGPNDIVPAVTVVPEGGVEVEPYDETTNTQIKRMTEQKETNEMKGDTKNEFEHVIPRTHLLHPRSRRYSKANLVTSISIVPVQSLSVLMSVEQPFIDIDIDHTTQDTQRHHH